MSIVIEQKSLVLNKNKQKSKKSKNLTCRTNIARRFEISVINFIRLKCQSRASNRLNYHTGSSSAKIIFSGSPPVQVFRRLILHVQFRLELKIF